MFWSEFLTITVVQILALASPGPDFAIIMRQALLKGRKEAYWASLGIAISVMFHASYCVLGIGALIMKSVVLFSFVKYLGALYLIYLGIKGIRSSQESEAKFMVGNEKKLIEGALQSFRIGFFTNMLNPKCTLFLLSLFSVVISPDTSLQIQVFYIFWLGITSMFWFVGLSSVIGSGYVRAFFIRSTHWIERITGAVLIGLGLKIATTD